MVRWLCVWHKLTDQLPNPPYVVLQDYTETVICFRWSELNQETPSYLVRLEDIITASSIRLIVVNNYDRCCIGNLDPGTEFVVTIAPFNSPNVDYSPITVATSKYIESLLEYSRNLWGVFKSLCVHPGIQREDQNQLFTFKVRTFWQSKVKISVLALWLGALSSLFHNMGVGGYGRYPLFVRARHVQRCVKKCPHFECVIHRFVLALNAGMNTLYTRVYIVSSLWMLGQVGVYVDVSDRLWNFDFLYV